MKLIDKVKLIDIDKICPYTNNPKEHPKKQINKIASSIKNFGFTVPIIIDNQNEIISGHGRYKAAQKLGFDKIPCIVRDDLNAAQIKAFRIADNQIAKSDWDQELLMIELGELEEADINIELTGFDEEEIENLFNVQEMSIEEIEDLLTDLSLEKTVEKPDWFVIRAPSKNRSEIEQALNKIKENKKIKVEQSYEKK